MAIIDQTIQSGVNIVNQGRVVRGSDGTLYTAYSKTATSFLFAAYSTDGGLTWTEVNAGSIVSSGVAVAIGSDDKLHVVYDTGASTNLLYRQFTVSGGWSASEIADTGSTSSIVIAIDSADDVHVAQASFAGTLRYTKRTAGSWAAATVLISSGFTPVSPTMVIDSNNYIYLFFLRVGAGEVDYMKYTGSWSAVAFINIVGINSTSKPSATVDSSNNIHVIWGNSLTNLLKYSKYTFATDLWSAEATVATPTASTGLFPTIGVDASNNLNVVFANANPVQDIYIVRNTGAWGTDTKIVDATNLAGHTQMQTTVWPLVGGQRVNISTTGYQFSYIDTTGGTNALRFYSSTDINFPAPQTQNYSRSDDAALPTTAANGDSLFTTLEYTEVATENSVYASQTSTDDYALFIFKDKGTASSDDIHVTWIGKTNIAASTSTVYLQIYKVSTTTWTTMSSNSSASAGANFTLSGDITASQSDYYDGSLWVTCRIYQLAQ